MYNYSNNAVIPLNLDTSVSHISFAGYCIAGHLSMILIFANKPKHYSCFIAS